MKMPIDSAVVIRARPCASCPYRLDVPSGIWSFEDYSKLRGYDRPTGRQPMALFMCHASPTECCSGWATCHERQPGHELLALRLRGFPEVPEHDVECFESSAEAIAHGIRDLDCPGSAAQAAMDKIERLRKALGLPIKH